jgi:hypothetical protein
MSVQHTERRAPASTTSEGESLSGIIRRALLIKCRTGVVSAIEYLKTCSINAALIERVMTDNGIRAEDKIALETCTLPLSF